MFRLKRRSSPPFRAPYSPLRALGQIVLRRGHRLLLCGHGSERSGIPAHSQRQVRAHCTIAILPRFSAAWCNAFYIRPPLDLAKKVAEGRACKSVLRQDEHNEMVNTQCPASSHVEPGVIRQFRTILLRRHDGARCRSRGVDMPVFWLRVRRTSFLSLIKPQRRKC